ncbi:MAG TPA: TIGR03936 family radical SAM-associated protein [Anaerolineales bacterium]|nr:TIGR03936 family radical SAM-associated protein [Anaerolineales bacterium]
MRIRITFSKQGALRYTGHLDLHKLWERAARRAELPLAYSQGFHPQPKMNLAAALPLGFASRCEIMDLRLEHDIALEGLAERLNSTLPPGIQVLNVVQVEERAPALQTQVASAEYEVRMIVSTFDENVKRRIESVMESESILRTRRGKEYDLRPLIEALDVMDDKIVMRLAAREGATGRPEEVLGILGIAFEETRIERTRLFFNLAKGPENVPQVSR